MIVIDASVGIKWIQEEENRKSAITLRDGHLTGEEKIIVPGLFFYEIANALSTKSAADDTYIKEGLNFIFHSHLIVENDNPKDLILSSVLAKKYNTSVYDMFYAVIANKHRTILVTADERFVSKTKFPFVKLLT